MEEIKIKADYVSFDSGMIKLTKDQYRKREHALKKTKEKDVYEIICRTGFKINEVVSYEGEIDSFIKSGMVSSTSEVDAEEYRTLVKSLNDKEFYKTAKSLDVDIKGLKREEAEAAVFDAFLKSSGVVG